MDGKFEERRKSDEKLEEIAVLIREIHQRQQETVIPCMENMKKTLYGNGKPGLCEKVSTLENTVKVSQWFVGIGASLIAIVISYFNIKK